MITADRLTDHALFKGLTPEQANTLLGAAQSRVHQGGDVVVRQFERNSDLLIISEGEVEIKSFAGDAIARLGPGSVVGEVALIDDAPRSATVVSVGMSKSIAIPASDFRSLMSSDANLKATVMENLAKILCGRLRASNV